MKKSNIVKGLIITLVSLSMIMFTTNFVSAADENFVNFDDVPSSNSSSNVQNSSTNNADSIPKKEEPIWCDEGGKKHWQGTGKNEHGYYKTWDAAWTECKNYMKDMKSGNYAVKECPCGLFYFWVEEN